MVNGENVINKIKVNWIFSNVFFILNFLFIFVEK